MRKKAIQEGERAQMEKKHISTKRDIGRRLTGEARKRRHTCSSNFDAKGERVGRKRRLSPRIKGGGTLIG